MRQLGKMSLFAHVVEAGSLSGAAEKLGLSKSVISQHLKVLEQELGVVLIKRTTRRQFLTEPGKRFYEACKSLNQIAEAAWEDIQAQQVEPEGSVHITAPNALIESLLTPIIGELMQQYPGVLVKLTCDDQHLDMMAHNIDIAVRIGTSKDSTLKQKRLGRFRDVLCGHARFSKEKLTQAPYIANAWEGALITHQFITENGEEKTLTPKVSCITNAFHSTVSLIRAGAGIGLVPDFYLKHFLKDVTVLLPQASLSENSVYLLTPFSKHTPMAVQVCMDALSAGIQDRLSEYDR
ncbi:transcriptional regulator [Pseudoalteromonas rubra]|uniref:Transcriptional regulator n=1 Tax=Pseudoalteromonas rubra TaxID=43658 RepID=A0A5S3WKP8_9GAMM|nr:LysR family transcriptional regulator [Pseudoalteromonas rubra]TMP28197.1 transcriptional regulator [Pseudoalteromonas rubra]TMP34899.1 transcriptional regulator [Pseudoalteromonas rubra]